METQQPSIPWGPTGELVYNRTYSRVKPDGARETWPETVKRVVDGNLGLVDPKHHLPGEEEVLRRMIEEFKIIPAGRHLWASGVKGRQYLFNCHVAGWTDDPAEHFRFTFLRLMEGGGVGANYTNNRISSLLPAFSGEYRVHIVCDPEHPDYAKLRDAGVLSGEFDAEWSGAFPVEDSREGWADALSDLLRTYYEGAYHPDRVYDVSRVRGEGSRLKTFGGRASGPLPLGIMLREVAAVMNRSERDYLSGLEAMEIDHAIAQCVVSGGNRRSARMSIMHWADPEIMEFIRVKHDGGMWTTNISVEVDDEFWERVSNAPGWECNIPRDQQALDVLAAIAEGMLHNGEPGIWNSSLSNHVEPNEVIATNPCGEIPLMPWENCNLGHVNLAAFVDGEFADMGELELAHELMTRFLIRATYGDVNDEKQAAVLARNRRIGVGHLGVASFLALQGYRYSDAPENGFGFFLRQLAGQVDKTAAKYAHQLRIPVPVKTRTVAPTGTIAKLPGVSEGIHPIYAKHFIRRIRFSDVDEDQQSTVEEYRAKGYVVECCQYAPETTVVAIPTVDSLMAQVTERFGEERALEIVESADDLSIRDMLAFQAMYQTWWADNAVSYTVNFDPAIYTAEELADYLEEFGGVLKGATMFPEFGMPQSPYERLTKDQYDNLKDPSAVQWVDDSYDEMCASGACPVK